MLDVRGFTYGLAIGAGAMYLFDPERGTARRSRLRDASRRVVHDVQHAMEVGTRDLENRTRGLGARARDVLSSGEHEEELSEDVLVARVRSRLGRVTPHAHAIEVRCKEGNEIELKGPALASEHDRIVRAASRVRGVNAIDDDLVVYQSAEGVPGLEGKGAEGEGGRQLPPGANLIAGAGLALLVLAPLAPVLVRTVLYAAIRALMHEAAPKVRSAVERIAEQRGDGGGQRREPRGEEWRGHPT